MLPSTLDHGRGPSPSFWPKDALAYIEWYTKLKPNAEVNHNMYLLKPLYRADGRPSSSITPLTSIRQSCMLFPVFGQSANTSWTTNNVLDVCTSFLVNNWSNMYAYKTLW